MRRLFLVLGVLLFTVSAFAQQTEWKYMTAQSIHGEHKSIHTNLTSSILRNQSPMLMFRNHATEGLGVVMGFNTVSFAGDNIVIAKFDNGPIEEFQVTYISNFMDMHLKGEDAVRFMDKAKVSKQVIVEHNIYNFGRHSFTFDLRKLNLNKLK